MAKKNTAEMTPEEMLALIKPCSPDDPIYKRGFVIGWKNASHFPKKDQEPRRLKGSDRDTDKE